MSIKKAIPKQLSASESEYAAPSVFMARHLAALRATACDEGGGSLRLTMAIVPGRGVLLGLGDMSRSIFTVIDGPAPTTEREIQDVVLDADGAFVAFMDWVNTIDPDAATKAWDNSAISILRDVFAGTAKPGAAAAVVRYIRHRDNCPRLDFDEAERLFGSTPTLDLSGDGPIIDWPELSELIGREPEFEDRKKIAQRICEGELNDVLEKAAGSMSAAFVRSALSRVGRK